MPNYTTKVDLKNVTSVDTSKIVEKVGLASLKCNLDKLDIDELKNLPTNLSNLRSKIDIDNLVPVPADLSKLSDGVKTMLLKRYI